MPAASSTRVGLGERESRDVEAAGGKSPGRGVKGAEARQTRAGRAGGRSAPAAAGRMRPSPSRGGPRGPALGPRLRPPVCPPWRTQGARSCHAQDSLLSSTTQTPGARTGARRRAPASAAVACPPPRSPAQLRAAPRRPAGDQPETSRGKRSDDDTSSLATLHPRFTPPLFCKICCEALSVPFRHQLVLKNLVSWYILPRHWGSRTVALPPRESPAACAHPRDASGLGPTCIAHTTPHTFCTKCCKAAFLPCLRPGQEPWAVSAPSRASRILSDKAPPRSPSHCPESHGRACRAPCGRGHRLSMCP